ncbi:hypothetical protein DQ937_13195 [Salmonella enterica subsp. enterica serovar Poona]|nr:hypothetical protein [Salmonella enterica subsp. enterica serovar Poona]EMB5315493.1 prophage tail fiber N-terminal domain-containing protein [Salmonella enterica]
MPVISGVLKDGAGQPIAGCTIQLKAINTTSAVIRTTTARVGVTAGVYRIEAQPARYEVTLAVEDYPPQKVGAIDIYADSPDGTLNDFLTAVTGDYVTPDVLKQFTLLAQQSREAAERVVATRDDIAKKAGDIDLKINASLLAIGQKTTETLTGLDVSRNNAIQAINQKQAEATGTIQATVGVAVSSADNAAVSARAARTSEGNADSSALRAETAQAAALYHAEAIQTQSGNIALSAADSEKSRQAADLSARMAAVSAQNAANSERNARNSEVAAAQSATTATVAAKDAVASAVPAAVEQVKTEIAGNVTRAETAATNAEASNAGAQQALEQARQIAKTPGAPGLPGKDGAPGLPGLPGAPGKDGKSAYEIWEDNQLVSADTSMAAFLNFMKGKGGAGFGEVGSYVLGFVWESLMSADFFTTGVTDGNSISLISGGGGSDGLELYSPYGHRPLTGRWRAMDSIFNLNTGGGVFLLQRIR